MIKTLFISILMNNLRKNANVNGLSYELLTNLNDKFDIIKNEKYHNLIKFKGNNKLYINTNKYNFIKFMENNKNNLINMAHGCKNPDDCFIDNNLNNLFIIEKKFQQTNGSTCEKIQTIDFKLWQYKRLYPNYNLIYIYSLSNWFKNNCKAELEYLNFKNIPIFIGDDINYKRNIINFILNYK